MRKEFHVSPENPVIVTTVDMVYGHRTEFCGAQYLPLKLSLIRPRHHFTYDEPYWKKQPVLIFLCGGAWIETDHNVWLAEMAWFAKHGYTVASVQYPITSSARFPDNIVAVRQAIRFLRKNADELELDMDHVILMGESAGGYIAALDAAVNDSNVYNKGEYLKQSTRITAAVAYYPPNSPKTIFTPKLSEQHYASEGLVPSDVGLPIDAFNYPTISEKVDGKSAPILLIHGKSDELVNVSNSEKIYAAWQKAGVRADLILIDEANHADCRCFQDEIKKEILTFMNEIISVDE